MGKRDINREMVTALIKAGFSLEEIESIKVTPLLALSAYEELHSHANYTVSYKKIFEAEWNEVIAKLKRSDK